MAHVLCFLFLRCCKASDEANEVRSTIVPTCGDEDYIPESNQLVARTRRDFYFDTLPEGEDDSKVSTIPKETEMNNTLSILSTVGGTFASLYTPTYTLFLLALFANNTTSVEEKSTSLLYIMIFPALAMTFFIFLILEVVMRKYIHSRLLEYDMILDFDNRKWYSAVLFLAWIVGSGLLFMIIVIPKLGGIGIFLSILLQIMNMIMLYKREYGNLERNLLTVNQFVELNPDTAVQRLSEYQYISETQFTDVAVALYAHNKLRYDQEKQHGDTGDLIPYKKLGWDNVPNWIAEDIAGSLDSDGREQMTCFSRAFLCVFRVFFRSRVFGLRLIFTPYLFEDERDERVQTTLKGLSVLGVIFVIAITIVGIIVSTPSLPPGPESLRVEWDNANTQFIVSWSSTDANMKNYVIRTLSATPSGDLLSITRSAENLAILRNISATSALVSANPLLYRSNVKNVLAASTYEIAIAGQAQSGTVHRYRVATYATASDTDPCSSFSTCLSCSAKVFCGFCSTGSGSCRQGNADRDLDRTCSSTAWKFTTADCTA